MWYRCLVSEQTKLKVLKKVRVYKKCMNTIMNKEIAKLISILNFDLLKSSSGKRIEN